MNGFLWVLLVGYFLQIEWEKPADTKPIFMADVNVPTAYLNHLKDSLKIADVVRDNALKTSSFRARLFDGTIDSVNLIGTGFSPDVLGQLSRQTVQWIPYYPPDQAQVIRWKGMVRKGEMQRVSGSIYSSQKQVLKLRFGNQTLDSLSLRAGLNDFRLEFPAFALGRSEVELVLNQKPLDTLRFFARNPEPVSYQFILDSPDFESKTLADWLGKRGHSVQLISTISKDIRNRVSINRAASPNVFITDPANATNPVVKKAAAQGKPVLFINVSDAEADCQTINQALGTNWKLKKVSNEATVSLRNGIQALPYQLTDAINQFGVNGYPVAIQKTAARIGLSLLTETFPLKLSGDSLAYDRIWTSILAQLQPSYPNQIQLEAPVFQGVPFGVHFNNLTTKPAKVRIGKDAVALTYSPINGLSAETSYRFAQSGWHPFQDSLAVYVEESSEKPVYGNRLVSDYLRARSVENSTQKTALQRQFPAKIPDWIWILLFIGSFTALWIEPKFRI
ncbi:hypothetical protein [Larkinella terrae]|uniref:Uncharacterized protein n=1 Tax=Larkinella terrae TaxID=2025311 RepID=A0A7K0EV28_9BACT|nr:hypothetical protein [Larkinella terrae]MRS65674.1 hypothetical protein [Larkinella terrae]